MPKLTRKSAKLFAENATAAAGGLAQFGSLAAGTPNYSTDPDVIQALQAYSNGWSAAVLGTKSPALEDRNALDYLLSYQQAYIMQRGIPEYLDTETYYIGSVVSDQSQIYISLTDNNTGNPLTNTTYWRKFYTPVEIDTLLTSKANTDLSNLSTTGQDKFDSKANIGLDNVTNTGKNTAYDWSKFDVTAKTGIASGTTFTESGMLGINMESLVGGRAIVTIDGVTIFSYGISGSAAIAGDFLFPVYKGQTVQCTGVYGLYFYPLAIN